jgi:hypothetical protein
MIAIPSGLILSTAKMSKLQSAAGRRCHIGGRVSGAMKFAALDEDLVPRHLGTGLAPGVAAAGLLVSGAGVAGAVELSCLIRGSVRSFSPLV